jgi:hypothetical protein
MEHLQHHGDNPMVGVYVKIFIHIAYNSDIGDCPMNHKICNTSTANDP